MPRISLIYWTEKSQKSVSDCKELPAQRGTEPLLSSVFGLLWSSNESKPSTGWITSKRNLLAPIADQSWDKSGVRSVARMMSSGSGFSLPLLTPLPVCWFHAQSHPPLVIAGWLSAVLRLASFHLPSSTWEGESLCLSHTTQSYFYLIGSGWAMCTSWTCHVARDMWSTDLSPSLVLHLWTQSGATSTLSLWAKNGEKLELWTKPGPASVFLPDIPRMYSIVSIASCYTKWF